METIVTITNGVEEDTLNCVVQEVVYADRNLFAEHVKRHIFRDEDIVLIDRDKNIVLIPISPDRVDLMHQLGYDLFDATDELGYTGKVLGLILGIFGQFVEFDDVIGEDFDEWDFDLYDDMLPCGCCACCGCSCYDDEWYYDEEDED